MTKQLKILVVEDSSSMRSFIVSSLLQYYDAQIAEAENGFEALKLLPSEKFDLILTDINMPDINGLELLRYLKENENYCHIPVIIVSTENTEADRKRGMSLGADSYLDKPFEPEALNKLIENLFSQIHKEDNSDG